MAKKEKVNKKEMVNNEETVKEEKQKKFSQEDILNVLNFCYDKCLNGVPKVSPSVEELANDYLNKHKTKEEAVKAMFNNQIAKCTTSGFITGFGGVLTMPVTLPANITSVLYVQMRMIACAAYMGGYDLHSDQVQTFVYACLAGVSVNKLVKQVGIKFGVKFAEGLVKKIPGKVLIKINQKVGFRFVTKFGTKGLVNLVKLVPVAGAVVGGSMDFVETKVISNRAYKWFVMNDFATDDKNEEEFEVVDEDLVIEA